MKKVLFAMLVSGMLISCTTNTESNEQQAADSTAQVSQGSVIPEEIEETAADEAEIEATEVEETEVEETQEEITEGEQSN